jgi:glycosyltransferase involved in cell wall biosynthesis
MSRKVSVGMLVYNEAENIARTIESILAQDFEGFELTISDNCSIDDTVKICQHYQKLDPRITIIRNSENIGAVANRQESILFGFLDTIFGIPNFYLNLYK